MYKFGLKPSFWRVPWATIFYAFQNHKKERNARLFDTMLFKLMKKYE